MSNPSKWIGFVIGGAEVIAGVILVATGVGGALGVELIISGSATILAQGVADLTAPKTPARDAAEMVLQIGEQPRSAFFGDGYTAGSLVDAFNFGGKYGTDWEVQIIRLADHKCDSLVQIKVNDEFIAYAGNGNYPEFNGEHYEMLHIHFRGDTSTETFPAEVTSVWPGWTAYDQGVSGCDVAVMYRSDTPKGKNPIWPGGRPQFGFRLKGKPCYDPRLDDTVGGLGSHRWDDPATWEWSENAIVCRYNWVRGIFANDDVNDQTKLLVGRGLSAQQSPPANIFAAANLCDEVVNGKPRYRVAGPVYSNQPFLEVEQMFEAATAGQIVTREGSVEIEPGAAKSISFTFTDDDVLSGSKVSWNRGILSDSDADWINTVVPNYVEPAQQWQAHDAPVLRNDYDVIADGGPRELKLPLRLVKDVDQAQRIGEIKRRMGRKWGRGGVTLGPRFCEVEEGDWGQWISARIGRTLTVRAETYRIDEKWQNTLSLREIGADCFDDSVIFEPDYSTPAAPTPPPPDVGSPAGTAWTLAAVTLTDGGTSVPALELTGDAFADDDQVEDVIVEYWKDDGVTDPVANPDDPAWIMEGSHDSSITKIDITSIEGGADYYVAVSYVVSGITGDRLVLGPATTAAIDVSGAVDAAASADVVASEAIAAAAFVNVYSASGAKVRNANATDGSKPVNGFAPAAIANGATGAVRGSGGKITGLAGLTPGATYYLDTSAGAITAVPPSGSGNLVQEIGVAVSATELLFNPKTGVTL